MVSRIVESERQLREDREATSWEEAASDPGFLKEADELEVAYGSADRETWPA
jgi:hypothetical protein